MLRVSILFIAVLYSALAGQENHALSDIRQIDFGNFRYPWQTPPDRTPRDFHWVAKFDTTVSLRDGLHVFKGDECGGSCPQAAIAEVLYTDVNDDVVEDAIVVLDYSSGGTAHWEYVYMYTVKNSTAKLIAAFGTGSRLSHGLNRVYVGNGHLIVELNEPDENAGECCATWRTRREYRWSKDRFEAASEPVKEEIPVHQRTWYSRPAN